MCLHTVGVVRPTEGLHNRGDREGCGLLDSEGLCEGDGNRGRSGLGLGLLSRASLLDSVLTSAASVDVRVCTLRTPLALPVVEVCALSMELRVRLPQRRALHALQNQLPTLLRLLRPAVVCAGTQHLRLTRDTSHPNLLLHLLILLGCGHLNRRRCGCGQHRCGCGERHCL